MPFVCPYLKWTLVAQPPHQDFQFVLESHIQLELKYWSLSPTPFRSRISPRFGSKGIFRLQESSAKLVSSSPSKNCTIPKTNINDDKNNQALPLKQYASRFRTVTFDTRKNRHLHSQLLQYMLVLMESRSRKD